MPKDPLQFAKYIKALRISLRLTQQDLADKVGVNRATITNLESGKQVDMHLSNFLRLARALKTHPMRLIISYQGGNPAQMEDNPTETELDQEILEAVQEVLKRRKGM